jgi:hypothetical protein
MKTEHDGLVASVQYENFVLFAYGLFDEAFDISEYIA